MIELGILCAESIAPITILWSVLVLFALALIFGLLLAFVGKKFAVEEDERIGQVRSKLSGANCGGCGYAGCDAFAKAIVEGKADISNCAATSKENKEAIGEIMGVSVSAEETKIVVCCHGGTNAKDKYEYMGYGDCRSMELLAGGRKECKWGCLGMGSCVDACPQHAIEVGPEGFTVIDYDKCVACGKCISVCPKAVVKRVPKKAKVFCACSNCLRGAKDVKEKCSVGCLGCGLCAKVCPNGAITMENNLPKFDYDKCTGCGLCADKCPAKTIKKLED